MLLLYFLPFKIHRVIRHTPESTYNSIHHPSQPESKGWQRGNIESCLQNVSDPQKLDK